MHRLIAIALTLVLCAATAAHEQARPVHSSAPSGPSAQLEPTSPTRAAGGTPPSGYPKLGRFLVPVEEALLRTLHDVGLTDRLIRIAADGNGHITAASLIFTFSGSGPEIVPQIQSYAIRLATAAYQAVPTLDELHLTAFRHDRGYFNAYRSDPSFTAAISRLGAAWLRRSTGSMDSQMRNFRAWYHPSIRPAADGTPAGFASLRERRPRPPQYHGGEHAVGFSGGGGERLQELRDRLEGHLRGYAVAGKIYRGPPARSALALTYDDGPMPIYTTLLLDSLRREGLKATFFVIGQRVRQYPYFAQAIVADGHEVANHSYSHVNLTHLAPEEVRDEIARAQRAIVAVTGQVPEYFRMPGGQYNRAILEEARRQNLTTVFWTAAPGDHHDMHDEALQRRLVARVYNGGIVLLHQGIPATLRILPGVRESLRVAGFQLVTVSSMMGTSSPIQARR